jgi:hypothetical protein
MLSKQVDLRIPSQPVLVGRIIELLPAARGSGTGG